MRSKQPAEDDKSAFCKQLRTLRRERELSQQDVADQLGVPMTTYSNWEQGRAIPSIHMLPKIADFYDISIDNLMGVEPKDVAARILQRVGHMTPDQREKLASLLESMFPGQL